MRNIIFILSISAIVLGGCKKTYNQISSEVSVSYPTISFPNGQYISIPVGGTVPAISITAYDSILKQSVTATDTGTVNNQVPGLYVLTAVARNANGYTSTSAIYVAVTNVSDTFNLSGTYKRQSNSQAVTITKKARGMYVTDNVGGVVPPSAFIIPAVFAQLNDSTLVLPAQPTSQGTLSASHMTLTLGPPVTISYVVINGNFGTSTRVFVKQ